MTHPIDAPRADSVTKLAEKAAEEIATIIGLTRTEIEEWIEGTFDIAPIIAAAIRSGIEEAEKENQVLRDALNRKVQESL